MITARDLELFEQQHGLRHPPYRDFNQWAESINNNGGACHCVPTRTCPCIEALDDIANSKDEKRACCACTLFCDERYLKAWKYDIQQTPSKPQEKRTTTTTEDDEIQNQEVADIINVLITAKKQLQNGKIMSAHTTLNNELDKRHCEACLLFLEAEAHRAYFLDSINKADEAAYRVDLRRAVERLDELVDLYRQVDKMEHGEQVDLPHEQITSERTYKSPYHKCTGETMKSQAVKDAYPDRKQRFAYAVSQCSTKKE